MQLTIPLYCVVVVRYLVGQLSLESLRILFKLGDARCLLLYSLVLLSDESLDLLDVLS